MSASVTRPTALPFGDRWLVGFDTAALPTETFDAVVIGSGIAGLTAALHLSRTCRVALVTKARLSETNTWYAQGGIAGAVGEADSVELHLADTLVVGQGLCDEDVVSAVVAEAPEALLELQALGMNFDLEQDGGVALAREGGHSLPRVLHSGDSTGSAIQQALTDALRVSGRVTLLERRFLVDLLADEQGCGGVLVFDEVAGQLQALFAGSVVLATGGAGQVFPVTTNPLVATGDGVAAAWRAGAEIADMEFVQFHPTALDSGRAPRFLVSEALRGEGAYLLDCDKNRFMLGVHPLAELAPRDVVSREAERVMTRCGRSNVWLDARHLGGERLKARFPTIWAACAEAGYDLGSDLVPVAPAAHYLIGGVRVDIDGRTSLPGLFASGEVAASGLHGANRLASNSLLEGLVFSRRIARVLADDRRTPEPRRFRATSAGDGTRDCEGAMSEVHALAGEALGMSREGDSLERASRRIAAVAAEMASPSGPAGFEVANLLCVAGLITAGATARRESRGCHYRSDFPVRDDERERGHYVWTRGRDTRFWPVRGSEASDV